MISELTKEQEEMMITVRNEWIDLFNSLEFDEKLAKDFVGWLYELTGFARPEMFVLDSPLACQVFMNASVKDDQLSNLVLSRVLSKVESQVLRQVSRQVFSKVESQVSRQVSRQVWSQVLSKVWRQNSKKYFQESTYGRCDDLCWVSLYDCFQQIGIKLECENFDKFKEYTKSGLYQFIPQDKYAVLCRPPVFLNKDNKGRMHSTSDAAIAFRDGFKLYYVHGVHFSPEQFNKYFVNKDYTGKDILSLKNSEQKAVLIQELGYDLVVEHLNRRVIDSLLDVQKGTSKKVKYELFEYDLHEGVRQRALLVGWYEKDRYRQTVLGVPPNIKSVNEGRAWTFCMTEQEYFNGKLKYRQGDVLIVSKNKTGGVKYES